MDEDAEGFLDNARPSDYENDLSEIDELAARIDANANDPQNDNIENLVELLIKRNSFIWEYREGGEFVETIFSETAFNVAFRNESQREAMLLSDIPELIRIAQEATDELGEIGHEVSEDAEIPSNEIEDN